MVLAVLAGAGLLYLGYRFVQVIESTRRILEVNREATVRLEVALNQVSEVVSPAVEEFRANMASVPKLLEAVTKVGEAQLRVAQQQRAEQEQRAREEAVMRLNPANAQSVWDNDSVFTGWGGR